MFPIISLLGANDPRDVASLDPRGLIGRIYVVDHYTFLHTKYISSGPHGFREEDFLSFSILSLWQQMTFAVWPIWTPGAYWQDLVGDHLTSLHT